MDKLFMHNMLFYGYHGVLSEEKTLGQMFAVDVTLGLELHHAGQADDIGETVSYAQVYDNVKEIIEGCSCNLIEKVAEDIARSILTDYDRVIEVEVAVKKPNPPINGLMDYAGVQIKRYRK